MNTVELRAKRSQAIGNARAILDRADAEKRPLSAEDRQAYDRLWDEQGKLKDQIETVEGDDERRRTINATLAELDKPINRHPTTEKPGSGVPEEYVSSIKNDRTGYSFKVARERSRYQSASMNFRFSDQESRETISYAYGSPGWERHQPLYRQQCLEYLMTGRIGATLQTDLATAGGYMVLPEQFVAELLRTVDDMRWIRQLARVFTTTAQTLGVVKRTAKMASFAWGAELTDTSTIKDITLAYGKRSLTPHYMTGEILASRDLLRSAFLPIETYIAYEIGRDSGELEENGFLTGNGTQQPLGLFSASVDGIDTSRDISTGNSTTQIGADNLREAKYSIKPQYRNSPTTRFLLHRLGIKQVSKLKDGDGQYLWQDGIKVGDPDMILGYGVVESEFAPSTFTTGKYVGLLGDFQFYWIADSLEMTMQTLLEKYAEINQIAYIARRKVDGMPMLAEAFARMKLA